jgi:cyanase
LRRGNRANPRGQKGDESYLRGFSPEGRSPQGLDHGGAFGPALLELSPEVAEALQQIPLRGSLDSDVPVDPTIYRIHEITQVYGTTIKALIHEEFGDGIMSAINFKMDIERVEDPEGERVRITYEGKFLPY